MLLRSKSVELTAEFEAAGLGGCGWALGKGAGGVELADFAGMMEREDVGMRFWKGRVAVRPISNFASHILRLLTLVRIWVHSEELIGAEVLICDY